MVLNKLGTARSICLLALLLFTGREGLIYADSWFNSSWAYRQDIAIPASGAGGTISNFPVLIHLNSTQDPNLWNPSYTKSNFYDLVFTDKDGATVLPYEIESSSATDLWIWVKLPNYFTATSASIGGNNHVYLYYGNPSSGNQANGKAVWDSNYQMVQHLNGSGSVLYDSTSNGINGYPNGTSSGAAEITNGQVFNNTNSQYINLNNLVTNGWTQFTIEAWINYNFPAGAVGNDARVLADADGTGANTIIAMAITDSATGGPGPMTLHLNGTTYTATPANAITTNTWKHVVISWNGGTSQALAYINGVASASNPIATGGQTSVNAATGDQVFLIGNADTTNDANSRPFSGTINEVRFSNTVRSANWIAASYTNQSTMSAGAIASGSITNQVFVGGTEYSDEGVSPVGSGHTVRLLINGSALSTTTTASATTTTNASGAWGFGIPFGTAAGAKFVAFGDEATDQAATVSTWGGSNLYSFSLYQNHVIVRNDDGGNPSVADMISALGGYSDANFPYNNIGTAANGFTLYVPPGTTFVPGASLNVGSSGPRRL